MNKQIVLLGRRPTGESLPLAELFGPLAMLLKLQKQGDKECYFFIANWHALTTQAEVSSFHDNALNAVVDYLAAGLDPEKCTIFIQSMISETAEIALLLSNCISFNNLMANSTAFKDIPERQKMFSAGFVFCPVLIAADILGPKADLVLVGGHERKELETAREIAKHFKSQYEEIFPVPKSCFVDTTLVDRALTFGMVSKGYGNTIRLDHTLDQIRDALALVGNDPARAKRSDPGNPTKCNVFAMEKMIVQTGASLSMSLGELTSMCRNAKIGCIDCRGVLYEGILKMTEPIQRRKAELLSQKAQIKEILRYGAAKARQRISHTLDEMRKALQTVF